MLFPIRAKFQRHLTVKMKKAETAPSPMMKSVQKEDSAKAQRVEAPAA